MNCDFERWINSYAKIIVLVTNIILLFWIVFRLLKFPHKFIIQFYGDTFN
jgi:hypothetical protein